MKDISKYLFRASSIGKLMKGVKPNLTDKQSELLADLQAKENPTDKQRIQIGSLLEKRDAKPGLSTGAKSYLNEIIQEVIFGRTKEITSKYLTKGIAVEEKSFTLYQKVSNNFLLKNKERFNNKWITGEPDNTQGKIRDIKSSWDFSTFPLHATEIPNDIYKWQLLAYMELTGMKEAELVYCLVDTPHKLIDDEIRKLSWKLGFLSEDSLPDEVVVETVSNLIYTEQGLIDYCNYNLNVSRELFVDFRPIKEEHRVKVFEMNYDYGMIKKMYTQLEMAREYLIDETIGLAEKLPQREAA